jgi:hypothetical protein
MGDVRMVNCVYPVATMLEMLPFMIDFSFFYILIPGRSFLRDADSILIE